MKENSDEERLMGSVEISMNEEGAVKVAQHYDIRALLTRQCFQRHRAAHCLHCSGLSGYADERKFNRVLMSCFLACLTVTVINVFFFAYQFPYPYPLSYYMSYSRLQQTQMFGYFETGQKEKALLAMFAAILAVGVLTKKVQRRRFCSSPPPQTKVQTVSSPVLHV